MWNQPTTPATWRSPWMPWKATRVSGLGQAWVIRTLAGSSRLLHLPEALDSPSCREWGMCHIYGGPLSHIREALCTNVWINFSWLWPQVCYESVLQSQLTHSRDCPKAVVSIPACLPPLLLPLLPVVTSHHLESPRNPGWKRCGVMWMTIVTLARQDVLTAIKRYSKSLLEHYEDWADCR